MTSGEGEKGNMVNQKGNEPSGIYPIVAVLSLVGAAIGIAGCFMPMASVSMPGYEDQVTWMQTGGVIYIVIVAVAVGLALFRLYGPACVVSGVAAVLAVVAVMNVKSQLEQAGIGGLNMVSLGVGQLETGAYLPAAGALVVLAATVFGLLRRRAARAEQQRQ